MPFDRSPICDLPSASPDSILFARITVDDPGSSTEGAHSWFVTTRWSVVAAAGTDSTRGRDALEQLCRSYWFPLYAFVRRAGHTAHDAEDLVQGFFARCIEKKYLATADVTKGRFRSFLLVMLKRFLAKEWRKGTAQKRGGTQRLVELDALTAEQRYAVEPPDRLTADQLYERQWALTLLENVLRRLQAEQAGSGRSALFEVLKETLATRKGTPYAELAGRLGMSEGAVKVAVHRLRERYRTLLEEEIAHTVATPEEIAEERRHLLSALSR